MNFVVSFVNQEVEVALSCQSESFDVEYTILHVESRGYFV